MERSIVKEILKAFKVPILMVTALWIIHAIFVVFKINPSYYALVPRRINGLDGILTSPLLHSDWGHLFNNSFPLLITGSIMYYFYRKASMPAIIIIYLLTGLAVWIFGHHGYHIGASGVAYGMVSFIFWSGIFRRNLESIILALIVVLLYSGMIVGIFPDEPGISWESHLFGALMGLLTAILFSGVDVPERKTADYGPEREDNFFANDIFDKTKVQRQQERLAEQERLRQEQLRLRQEWINKNNPPN